MLTKVHLSSCFSPRIQTAHVWLSDLNSALKLEPKNTSIQDELKRAEQAIAVEKSKARQSLRPSSYVL